MVGSLMTQVAAAVADRVGNMAFEEHGTEGTKADDECDNRSGCRFGHSTDAPPAARGPWLARGLWRVRRVGPEQPGLAVPFGLGLMVAPAESLDIRH
jgi:hypothetical protein